MAPVVFQTTNPMRCAILNPFDLSAGMPIKIPTVHLARAPLQMADASLLSVKPVRFVRRQLTSADAACDAALLTIFTHI